MDWTERIGRRLNPRDLHVFMAVVEQGTMAKAAEHLAISRPVVSKTIADLEHTLGVPLFDRSPQGVEPTLYGRALLARGVAVFDELRQGIKDIEFLADPTTGELKIGCPGSIASTLLPQIVQQFLTKYPRILLHADAVTSPASFPGLRERKYDLFLTMLPLPADRVPDGLNLEVLFNDQLVVAAGKHTRWEPHRKIDLADLAAESWVLPGRDSWNYLCLEEAFRTLGLAMPKIVLWSNFVPLRNHLIANGQFLTAVSNTNAKLHGMKILSVDLPVRPWPVVIVTVKNRTLSPIVKLFTEFVRDFSKPMRVNNVAALKHKRRNSEDHDLP
jgi:DNA-binding transcriptional LysR family regulator